MVDVSKIVGSVFPNIEKKAIGGLNPNSVESALKQVAAETAKQTEEAAQKTLKEVQNAAKTTQKNLQGALTKSTEENSRLQTELNNLSAQNAQMQRVLENRPHIKIGKPKVLPNGNIETVKTSALTGARMTTQTLPNERVLSRTVETVDGDIRKTTYNPNTGKPIKTFTNTRGDVLIEYTPDGHQIRRVNNKKVKQQPPEVLSEEFISEKGYNKAVKRTYSDGSCEIAKYGVDLDEMLIVEKYDPKGRLVQKAKRETSTERMAEHLRTKNWETGKIIEELKTFKLINGRPVLEKTEKSFLEKVNDKAFETIIKKEISYPDGLKCIIKAPKDEYCIYNLENPTMTWIYPKNSKIKKSEIEFSKQFLYPVETITLKDGTKIVTGPANENYYYSKLSITSGDGKTKIIDDYSEVQDYLKTIGKITYKENNKYFSNSLN